MHTGAGFSVIQRKAVSVVIIGQRHLIRAFALCRCFGVSLGSIRTTVLRYALRHDHKTAVVAAVLTGRQRNELIAVFSGHAGIIEGQFLALGNKVVKLIGALCVYKAIKLECFGTVGVDHRAEYGNDLILLLIRQCVEGDYPMLAPKVFVLELFKVGKH